MLRYELKLESAARVRAEAVPKAGAARRERLQPAVRVSTPLLRVDLLLTETVALQNALHKECANLMGCLKKVRLTDDPNEAPYWGLSQPSVAPGAPGRAGRA